MNHKRGAIQAVSLFSNFLKFCRITRGSKDTDQFPVQQVEYHGKAADVFIVMPYGSHANIPPDFLGLLFQISDQEENRAVLPLSAKERIKPLAEGEVVFFHPVTGSKIHFKNNGDIDIVTTADINATCANANITATTSVTVDTPTATFTGDVIINKSLTVTDEDTTGSTFSGDTEFETDITNNSNSIGENHTHSQGNDSNGDTEVETNGVT